ncbi:MULTISPECIES: hypothetical protein [Burkholderia]|uniref:hypothetical protein n=1 Tax=Burkholderia TaxID=32008 RepID=UPI000FDA5E13|nr:MULTISPECIES: hypothetical protein [Burkholderia]MBJ9665078.1 hypothetical protein [Burkholderia gladioli]MDN7735870.1 hypothetical protein [Burkholderia gladioli]MDN7802764.1 hypothetical protein [Burkholderia gladioli]
MAETNHFIRVDTGATRHRTGIRGFGDDLLGNHAASIAFGKYRTTLCRHCDAFRQMDLPAFVIWLESPYSKKGRSSGAMP